MRAQVLVAAPCGPVAGMIRGWPYGGSIACGGMPWMSWADPVTMVGAAPLDTGQADGKPA